MPIKDLDINTLRKLFHKAIEDGFEQLKIEPPKDDSFYFNNDYHDKLPILKVNEDGLQTFDLNRTAINHEKYFKRDSKFIEIESWSALKEYLLNSEDFLNYWEIGENSPKGEFLIENLKDHGSYHLLANIIDHYVHYYRSKKYNKKRIDKYFNAWVKQLYSQKLFFEIWIPLICVDFEFNSFKINEHVSFRKIPESITNARLTYLDDYDHNRTEKKLIGACKYAIVLNNWFVENFSEDTPRISFNRLNLNKDFERTAEVLIGLLFIFNDIQTGFYQVVGVPSDWSYGYKTNFKTVLKTYIPSYSSEIANPYSIGKIPVVSKSQLRSIKKIYKYLTTKSKNKKDKQSQKRFSFCLRKIYQARLREKISDQVLDYCIVLESLLTNDSKSEITYRMSIRSAYICKLYRLESFNPTDIKELIVKLYSLRSSIIHGNSDSDIESKIMHKIQSNEIDLVQFAKKIVMHLYKVLIFNRELQDYKVLESRILIENNNF